MLKTARGTRKDIAYIAVILGASLTSLSVEFLIPPGIFLGTLATLRALQVMGEGATVPLVLSLFITDTVREVFSSAAPGVKWWVYLALGVAALARDWRRASKES